MIPKLFIPQIKNWLIYHSQKILKFDHHKCLLLYTSSKSSAVGLTEGCFFKHSCTNSTKQEDLKFTHKKHNFNFLAWYYRAAQIKRICICPNRSTFSQSKQNILLDIHAHWRLYVDLNFFNYYSIPNLNCSLWFNTFNWHVQLTLTLRWLLQRL